MNPRLKSRAPLSRGNVLLMVMIMIAVSLTMVTAIFNYSANNAKLNQRTSDYYLTTGAAEAATEKVVSQLTSDYRNYGDGYCVQHLSQYRTLIPSSAESGTWTNFDFMNLSGDKDCLEVQYYSVPGFANLGGQYGPLKAWKDRFRILSNARMKNSTEKVVGSVYQDIELSRIPIFQYAIFYNTVLEFTAQPDMNIYGPVHCNTNIYVYPIIGKTTFWSDLTASGTIYETMNPVSPLPNAPGTIVYKAAHDGGVSTLNLPIGTNNSPAAVRQVLELPPAGEDAGSSLGQQRYYNKADLIVLVSNSTVVVKTGLNNNFTNTLTTNDYTVFLSTNGSFFNKRENKTVLPIQLDIGQLVQWNLTNSYRSYFFAQDVRTIYVSDQRTFSASQESGIRLVNGATLPPKGLTVATSSPLYILGYYNCPVSARGTTNTLGTMPASIAADAITVLSPSWVDTNSSKTMSIPSNIRVASDCTVNAAFLMGIVATTSSSDSGGVENFPRFLEEWTGKTLTYNGSMVCMFYSQVATGQWKGTVALGYDIYNPPNRNWGLDANFQYQDKLPPATPTLTVLVRSSWRTPAAFSTNVVAGF